MCKKATQKILNIGINVIDFHEIFQNQKRDNFKEKHKKRASIEGKNAEFKQFHWLNRARDNNFVYGVKTIQTGSHCSKF